MPPRCARAGPAAVVRIWSGLGYNRRALNLHRAARIVVAEHGGVVPADESALRSLPGIGPYTARAVRSFAFGADVATVDTNALRVLSRCVAGAPLTVSQAQHMADRLIPAGRSWDFNQTMFDLGATVCTADARLRRVPPVAAVPLAARRDAWPGPLAGEPVRSSPVPLCRFRPSGSRPTGPGAPRRSPARAGGGRRLWLAR